MVGGNVNKLHQFYFAIGHGIFDAPAATTTVMMLVPVIPALSAAENSALVAMTMMASTLIPHKLPPVAAPPLNNTKRIIFAAHCAHIFLLCVCLAPPYFCGMLQSSPQTQKS